jgi:hypothetical protein
MPIHAFFDSWNPALNLAPAASQSTSKIFLCPLANDSARTVLLRESAWEQSEA